MLTPNYVPMAIITEEQLRNIIKDELLYSKALNEGIWDDVKSGTKKLVSAVTSRISAASVGKINKALQQAQEMPKEVKTVMDAIKHGMQETGESVKLDDTLQKAKELGKISHQSAGEMLSNDLEGPVHAKAKTLQTENIDRMIKEFDDNFSNQNRIDELGIVSGVGMFLAVLGGIPIALKGLSKLASFLGAKQTSELLHKAEHVMHSLEEKVIDKIVPDVLSYAVYTFLWSKGFRMQSDKKRQLNREEYSNNLGDAKKKIETLMYSALLIFFAWNGIKAALHAGASLLGFAEGTATAVKSLEIGRAAVHIADVIDIA